VPGAPEAAAALLLAAGEDDQRRGLAGGEQAVVEPWPTGFSEGAAVTLEIVRQAWREPGRPRLAKARVSQGHDPAPAAALPDRLVAAGHRLQPGWPDWLEAQWADGFEAAALGRLLLPGGQLGFVPTPAFTAVDVDGSGAALARDAAVALARAIRLWGLGGAIVVDFPDCGGKAGRSAVADAFDAAMGDAPFERTAINGFGLMQVICPRPGPSILERARLEADAGAAIALLDLASREPRPGAIRLVAAPAIIGWIAARPELLEAVRRSSGRALSLSADPMARGGHVETIQ
jgi:hypothetical protein